MYERFNNVHQDFMKALKILSGPCITMYEGLDNLHLLCMSVSKNVHNSFMKVFKICISVCMSFSKNVSRFMKVTKKCSSFV